MHLHLRCVAQHMQFASWVFQQLCTCSSSADGESTIPACATSAQAEEGGGLMEAGQEDKED